MQVKNSEYKTSHNIYSLLFQEIFGPVLSVYVYPESDYKKVLQLVDNTSPYALTGAVFAQDKWVLHHVIRLSYYAKYIH